MNPPQPTHVTISVAELEKLKAAQSVIEMGLCEYPHVGLRPNQLYRFIVMPNCDKCKAEAEAYKPPDTNQIIESLTV